MTVGRGKQLKQGMIFGVPKAIEKKSLIQLEIITKTHLLEPKYFFTTLSCDLWTCWIMSLYIYLRLQFMSRQMRKLRTLHGLTSPAPPYIFVSSLVALDRHLAQVSSYSGSRSKRTSTSGMHAMVRFVGSFKLLHVFAVFVFKMLALEWEVVAS